MSDITICLNDKCKYKEECYRYNAIPDKYWQSYTMFESKNKKEKCEYYIEI